MRKEQSVGDAMNILRKESRRGYTHIDNDLADAQGLSFRAKGIALVLLSKPNNWEIKIAYLMAIGKEGEQAIRTAMHELATFGFLMRIRERDEHGRVRTVTKIADYPAYIDIGTAETRINGYGPGVTETPTTDLAVSGMSVATDLAETDRSVNRRSENRQVGNRQVLVTTDVPTTEVVTTERDAAAQRAASPSSKTKKGGSKATTSDAPPEPKLSDHPLIQAYRDLHHRNPSTAQMRIIVDRNPPVSDWIRAIRVWASRDYKPTNFDGMLEWAFNPSLMEKPQYQKKNNLSMRNGDQEENTDEKGEYTGRWDPQELDRVRASRRAKREAARSAANGHSSES